MEAQASTRRSSTGERLTPRPKLTSPITFHYEIQDHATRLQRLTKAFKVYRLTVLTFVCVAASFLIGIICRPYARNWTERQFMYVEFPGELYLRLLKLIIIPLLVSNVILSFGTMQRKLSSHFGKVACFMYLASNLMAITIAIALALIVCPGRKFTEGPDKPARITIQLDYYRHYDGYHESMKRYREYHPMFYHTDRDDRRPPDLTGQHFVGQTSASRLRLINTTTSTLLATNFTNFNKTNGGKNNNNTTNFPFQNIPKAQEPILESIETTSESLTIEPVFVGPESIENSQLPAKVSLSGNNISFINEDHRLGLSIKLPIDVLLDVLRNLVPDSIIGATLQTTKTRLFAPQQLLIDINGTTDPAPDKWPMGHEMVDQANIIGLLAISVLTGVILSHMDEAARPFLDLCACISELSIRVGMLAIQLTPFCIMFLLIGQVARSRDLSSVAGELFMYSLTVMIALTLHGFILLPLIYYLVTRKSPIEFLFNMHEALVAAFATSSSSASMALMLKCLNKMELNPVIVGAFGPLGSVFNMNGTAIYEAIGGLFIAQTIGAALPLTSLLLVGLSAAVASFSTSGIPSSGMMTMVIVLNAINLPVLQLSLIYIVDFIIDRFRTVINVWSGSVVCALINHLCPDHLFEELVKQGEKYREKRTSGAPGRTSDEDKPEQKLSKPKVISVTITPPIENSHI